MRYAYVDQNFLSSCAERTDWIERVCAARREGIVTLVLSPLHFYEFGNARADVRERILAFVEQAEPVWTFTQADLQMLEFAKLWANVWGYVPPPFSPLCDLREVLAVMHRVLPEQVGDLSVREIVSGFQGSNLDELWNSMGEQERAATVNQYRFRNGNFTPFRMNRLECLYVAVHLARIIRDVDRVDTYRRAVESLEANPSATQIEMFVYWQCHTLLKSYQVESALASQMWSSDARLSRNRVVDRQHAVVALSYCDELVTDDRDLVRRCESIRKRVKFSMARLHGSESFVNSLSDYKAG